MWKALVNDVFGKMKGEIFDAPLHAVQAHLEKGEIEEVKEIPKVEKPIEVKTEVLIEETPKPKKRGRPKKS